MEASVLSVGAVNRMPALVWNQEARAGSHIECSTSIHGSERVSLTLRRSRIGEARRSRDPVPCRRSPYRLLVSNRFAHDASGPGDGASILVPLITDEENSQGGVMRSLESWLEAAVVDIVRHLEDAPFLQYVFDSRTGHGRALKRLKVPEPLVAHPDGWREVQDELVKYHPDSVIFVHRLEDGTETSLAGTTEPPSQQLWGLVVQAHMKKRHACYILRTTRVSSLAGTCTRFSVTRASSFGSSLSKQMEKAWRL